MNSQTTQKQASLKLMSQNLNFKSLFLFQGCFYAVIVRVVSSMPECLHVVSNTEF